MPFADIVQNFGDAISGTDREAALRKGMAERAKIDETQAQTEASMQLARDRRLEAEKKERQKAAEQALREKQANLNDPDQVPGIDVMTAGLGSEYSALQAGREHAQTYREHKTVSTPAVDPNAGFGDATAAGPTEEQRQAALESLAPGSALASQRPPKEGADPLKPVIDENGNTVYRRSSQADGAKVGTRPSASAGKPPPMGGISTPDSAIIFRQASQLFGGTYDPTTGRFAGLDKAGALKVQQVASVASQIFKRGGVDHATAVGQALEQMKALADAGQPQPGFGDATAAPAGGGDAPATDPFEGRTATNAQGVKLVKHNGQWVPVQ